MDFYNYILVIFIFFNEALTYEDENFENSENAKMNVVLFLAESSLNLKGKDEVNEIPCLHIPLIGKVKPCLSDVPRSSEKRCPNIGNCKRRLESGIVCLNKFVRNTLGMCTAIVSLTKEEVTDQTQDGYKYFNYKLETIDTATPKQEVVYIGEPKKTCKDRNKKYNHHPYSNIQNDKLVLDKNGDIPVLSIFPSKSLQFNNIHKYEKNRKSVEEQSHSIDHNPIMEPEHTHIDVVSSKKPPERKSLWELLGLMSAMRNSFFANFMTPMLDPEQRMRDEEEGMNYQSIGQQQELALFQLVKRTLSKIKKQSKTSGFLMIVIGGNLTEIKDISSDLVQSIKHVSESTDSHSTLIIVTGNCPTTKRLELHADTCSTEQGVNDITIPVYAKGPNSNVISRAFQLADVPKQIKEALKKNNGEKSNKGSSASSSSSVPASNNDFRYEVVAEDEVQDGGAQDLVKRDVSNIVNNQVNTIKTISNKFAIYVLFIFLNYVNC